MLGCGSALLDNVSGEAPDHKKRLATLLEVLRSDDAPRVLALWDGVPKVNHRQHLASIWRRLVRAAVMSSTVPDHPQS